MLHGGGFIWKLTGDLTSESMFKMLKGWTYFLKEILGFRVIELKDWRS